VNKAIDQMNLEPLFEKDPGSGRSIAENQLIGKYGYKNLQKMPVY